MSPGEGRLEIVAVPSGGRCDPATGTCSNDADDGASSVEAGNENAGGDVPGAAQR